MSDIVSGLFKLMVLTGWLALAWLALGALYNLARSVWSYCRRSRLFTHGTCEGCGRRACPLIGAPGARRRDFAYCHDCMPELRSAIPRG